VIHSCFFVDAQLGGGQKRFQAGERFLFALCVPERGDHQCFLKMKSLSKHAFNHVSVGTVTAGATVLLGLLLVALAMVAGRLRAGDHDS